MINRNLKKKLIGLIISSMLLVVIFLVLIPPATAVRLDPGSPDDTSVTTGTTITFNDVNLTIRGLEKIPVNNLTFKIFNNANDQQVAYVIFYINGTELEDPSDKFTVTNTTTIDDNWNAYGYQNGTDENPNDGQNYNFGYGYGYGYGGTSGHTDITFLYDIAYTTHTTGTFYAKLLVNSTSHTYNSSKSTTFTVSSSGGGGTTPPTEEEEEEEEEAGENEASNEVMVTIEDLYDVILEEPFNASDIDGDGILDSFSDPNGILTLIHTINISGNPCFLISVDGDEIPEFFWDPAGDNITTIYHNVGIITDSEINAADEIIVITIRVEKANWTYIEINDPYPKASKLVILASDGRSISSDLVWREDNVIKILDDPTIEYFLVYDYEQQDILLNVSLDLSANSISLGDDVNALIKIRTMGELKIINGSVAYTLSKDGATIWHEEEDLLLIEEFTMDRTITTNELSHGEYIFEVTYNYGDGQVSGANAVFIIEPETPSEGVPFVFIIIGLVALVSVLVLVFLFKIGFLEIVRDDEREK